MAFNDFDWWHIAFNRRKIMAAINMHFYDFFDKIMRYNNMKNRIRGNSRINCDDLDPDTLLRFQNLELQGIKLVFREGQFDYLRSVIEAIDEKKIMLLQGPVGIGKTFGYLLPLIESHSRGVLKKIVITTASIDLQNQLLEDIEKVCRIRGIDRVEVRIAKGIGNYACLKEVYRCLESQDLSEKDRACVRRILSQILEKSLSDKKDFESLTKKAWEAVKLKSRDACSGCQHASVCSYFQHASKLKDTPFRITNHGYLMENLSEFEDVDVIVADEVHKLSATKERSLSFDDIFKLIDYLFDTLDVNDDVGEVKQAIKKVFFTVGDLAEKEFHKKNKRLKREKTYSIVGAEKLPFKMNSKLRSRLISATTLLSQFCNEVMLAESSYLSRINSFCTPFSNKYTNYKADIISKKLAALREVLFVLQDMQKIPENGSDVSLQEKDQPYNIYYVSFLKKGRINLGYCQANTLEKFERLFNSADTFILTSATMGAHMGANEDGYICHGDYQPIKDNLCLDVISRRADVEAVPSVFPEYDYESQVLPTIDLEISEPNDSDEYVAELAKKIDYAIRISEGKALILFTSKDIMNRVYSYISSNYKYPFKLLLHTDNNAQVVKSEFSEDINSCLFATGTFWEGIDIKGPALSNLIITHLPFDNVDAITEARIKKYASFDEAFHKDILPRMRMKFVQGFGRLIRSSDDTGLFFCFDPRVRRYIPELVEDTLISAHMFKVNNYSHAMCFYRTRIKPRVENPTSESIIAGELEWERICLEFEQMDDISRQMDTGPLILNGFDLLTMERECAKRHK